MPSDSSTEIQYKIPGIPQQVTHGADELNLAEFPICSFSSNPTQRHGNVLTFEDQVPDPMAPGKTVTRRLEILSASKDDPLGPLTPDDDWVLLGLLQLSKLQNFPKEIRFTRYQLLKLIGWQTNARDYNKVRDSLMRLRTFQFRFYNGFFDAKAKSFISASFNLFNDLNIYEKENSLTRPKPNPHQDTFLFACSSITWSDRIHGQFLNRGVKGINFDFAKSLKRPLTRRLFRYLDKNFYFKPELSYDLESFVTAHLGLTACQEFRDIKKTLGPAIAELEELRFIQAISEDERFVKLRRTDQEMEEGGCVAGRKLRRFKYRIVFHRGELDSAQREEEALEQPLSEAHRRALPLIKRGIVEDQALKLANAYPDSIILHHVDIVDWQEKRGFQMSNKGGYLRDRIVNHKDRPDPPGFIPRAQREALLDGKQKREEAEKRGREASEKAKAEAKDDFEKNFRSWWDGLGEEGRKAVDTAILAQPHDAITLGYLEATTQTETVKSMWKGFRVRAFCAETGVKAWG